MTKKVVLAMSGGIDSSVAAYLLTQQGFEVIGVTFVMFDELQNSNYNKNVIDAKIIADFIGIKHYVLDLKKEFQDKIINNFIEVYKKGQTPNPCVLCNPTVKWKNLLDFADSIGVNFVATGHYAAIKNYNNQFYLSAPEDEWKNQIYFLWNLTQEQLKRTIFPLSDFSKQKIKEIAISQNFDNLIKKRESYDICFIKNKDYRDYLKEYFKVNNIEIPHGKIITKDNLEIGTHFGLPYYTIGQRKNIPEFNKKTNYVIKIDSDKNLLIVGQKEDLETQIIFVKNFNFMKYLNIDIEKKYLIKIRYKDKGVLGYIFREKNILKVTLDEKIISSASGQSIVFFENNDLVGGGVIV